VYINFLNFFSMWHMQDYECLMHVLFISGQPKRHLLTTGWSVFVSSKRLIAGDSVLFIRYAVLHDVKL